MAGFSKLLLCVADDDDAAVRHVARLAAATSADLTIADVIDPRVVIGDFATNHHVDLLIVGTVGHSGVAGRIVGNTAEAVMTRLPCSMLVVKPDDRGARSRQPKRESAGRSGGRA